MSVASVDTIAKLLDMTPRRVQQLANEGIIPKPKDRGQYEVVPCVVRYIKHIKAMLSGNAGDLMTEKARLTRAQAEKTEIEISRLNGVLIPLADAERGWSAMVGAFRGKAVTIPPRAAPLLVGREESEIERILTDMIFEALAELADWKPDDDEEESTERAGQGGADCSTAAEDPSEPVG